MSGIDKILKRRSVRKFKKEHVPMRSGQAS
jgi:hypothetical protein